MNLFEQHLFKTCLLGGDDRRVLLWDVNKVVRKGDIAPSQMKTEHLSNIFCTVFDNDTKHIFSAGMNVFLRILMNL